MRIPIELIPQENIAVWDGQFYIEVQKGIYTSPTSGIITNQLLYHRLAIYGYHQTKFKPGLWDCGYWRAEGIYDSPRCL
jgi:hypothetical protein